MQDKRRRGSEGDVLDQAVETAIREVLEGLPRELQIDISRRLRATIGHLLSTAPIDEADLVTEIRNRARLAAAFRVKLPGDPD